MLEELFNVVKGVASQNPSVPSAQKNEITAEATHTVASGLRNMVAGGGLENVVSLFSHGGQQKGGGLLSNPIVSMMVGHFADKLMSKYNLGNQDASQVASNMIPAVLGNLVNKANDSNSGFPLENLLNSITGGKMDEMLPQHEGSGGGINDILSRLSGGNSNTESGGGLMDIISQLAGGAQQQQKRNGGGGLMDLIKGFIG